MMTAELRYGDDDADQTSNLRSFGADTRVQAALAIASWGGQVLPCHTPIGANRCSCGGSGCRSIGKHPRTTNGLSAATHDPDTIRRWWGQWPEANLGLRTGEISGVFVVDVDPDGFDAFEDLCTHHGCPSDSLETWSVRTGRLGAHVYFRHPGAGVRIRTSAGALAPGVDVRGDGGYAILPPSLHASGKHYGWLEDRTPWQVGLARAPGWLLSLVISRPSDIGSDSGSDVAFTTESIPSGQRNATLTSLAGSMRRRGFGEAAILAALTAENADRCAPPLAEDEVARIARSIARYPSVVHSGINHSGLRVREVRRA